MSQKPSFIPIGYWHCGKCKSDTNHKMDENGKLNCLKCEKKRKEKEEKKLNKSK